MKKTWRILLVSEPGRDGVLTCVSSLIRHLHRHHPRIGVDFFYSSRRGGVELERLVEEVRIHHGEVYDMQIGNSPEKGDWAAARKILEIVRRREIRLVHGHSSKAGALVRFCRIMPGFPPVLYTPHAYYGMPRVGGKKEVFFNLLEALLGRIGWTQVSSEDERDFAQNVLRLNRNRLKVVHNGVDTRAFCPAVGEEKVTVRRELGLPLEGKILATIGRDSSQKNYAPLYASLERMLPGRDWVFAHAGAGSVALRASLSEPVRRQCHAYEHLNDTVPLLQAADGFVLTSRYEGLSISMLHALSCGLPLLVPDAPGFRLLKNLGFTDIYWLPDPAEGPLDGSLDAALCQWATQPSLVQEEQRRKACLLFTESTQLEKLIDLYEDLVQSRITR